MSKDKPAALSPAGLLVSFPLLMDSSHNRDSSFGGSDEGAAGFASSPCYLHEFADFGDDDSESACAAPSNIRIRRVYEPPAATDGKRYLIDRLWPRGLSKKDALLDAWLKEVAPSPALRQWFHKKPQEWEEFSRRYLDELKHSEGKGQDQLKQLAEESSRSVVTLLYAFRNEEHNHAQLLKQFLEQRSQG